MGTSLQTNWKIFIKTSELFQAQQIFTELLLCSIHGGCRGIHNEQESCGPGPHSVVP